MSSKDGNVRQSSRALYAKVDPGNLAAAAVGGIESNAAIGIGLGVVVPIVAIGTAVLALIILRRRRRIDSSSAQAFNEETSAIVPCDAELSDFVSGCGSGSIEDIWESPSVDHEPELGE